MRLLIVEFPDHVKCKCCMLHFRCTYVLHSRWFRNVRQHSMKLKPSAQAPDFDTTVTIGISKFTPCGDLQTFLLRREHTQGCFSKPKSNKQTPFHIRVRFLMLLGPYTGWPAPLNSYTKKEHRSPSPGLNMFCINRPDGNLSMNPQCVNF